VTSARTPERRPNEDARRQRARRAVCQLAGCAAATLAAVGQVRRPATSPICLVALNRRRSASAASGRCLSRHACCCAARARAAGARPRRPCPQPPAATRACGNRGGRGGAAAARWRARVPCLVVGSLLGRNHGRAWPSASGLQAPHLLAAGGAVQVGVGRWELSAGLTAAHQASRAQRRAADCCDTPPVANAAGSWVAPAAHPARRIPNWQTYHRPKTCTPQVCALLLRLRLWQRGAQLRGCAAGDGDAAAGRPLGQPQRRCGLADGRARHGPRRAAAAGATGAVGHAGRGSEGRGGLLARVNGSVGRAAGAPHLAFQAVRPTTQHNAGPRAWRAARRSTHA
jgi:hypothetical protein